MHDLKGTICDQCVNNKAANYKPLTPVEMKLKKQSQIALENEDLSRRFSEINC